jgi:cytochrome P450
MAVPMGAVLDLDALRPGFTDDPYPVYAKLREDSPVREVTFHGLRAWLVTRHADVAAALADPRLSNDPRNANAEAQTWPTVAAGLLGPLSRSVVMIDEPDHSRLRRLIGREFTPRRMAALRPRIEQICAELIDAFAHRGSADLIGEFAALLPLAVICELLGVPTEDRPLFRSWALVVGGVDEGSASQQHVAFAELAGYLSGLIESKRGQQGGFAAVDMLGGLVEAHAAGQLSDQELLSMPTVLLLAGAATTTDLIGNGMFALLRHPDQMAALRADPSLTDDAVEEFLRYDCPVNAASLRYTTETVRIGDVDVPPNEVVILALQAANHDPAQATDPEAFDIRRTGQCHLSFGYGRHFCLGAGLARLEAQIAFPALLAGCPDMVLAAEPAWRVGVWARGLHRLPVAFTPRR